jgi:chorismate mutase
MFMYILAIVLGHTGLALLFRAFICGDIRNPLRAATIVSLFISLLSIPLVFSGILQDHIFLTSLLIGSGGASGIILSFVWPTKKSEAEIKEIAEYINSINQACSPVDEIERYILKVVHQFPSDEISSRIEGVLVKSISSRFEISDQVARIKLHNALIKRQYLREGYKTLTGRDLQLNS